MATGVACPSPFIQSFNNAGAFNVGGSILTQVGGINTATYQDIGLTIPLPNPIPINSRGEVSDSSGHSQQLFLTPNIVYVFTYFDKNSNQLDQASYVNGVQLALTQSTIGAAFYPITANEIAAVAAGSAASTPTFYYYPEGNVLRYGADPSGVASSVTAIKAAVAVAVQGGDGSGIGNHSRIYFPHGNYLVDSDNVFANPLGATGHVQRGIIVYGDGMMSSMIQNNTSTGGGGRTQWLLNGPAGEQQYISLVFQDIAFNGDSVGAIAGRANGFLMYQSQNIMFYNCWFNQLGTAFEDAGTANGDATKFFGCRMSLIYTRCLLLNNPQYLNIELFGCTLEQIFGDIFTIATNVAGAGGGGALRMYGGSIIMSNGSSATWIFNIAVGANLANNNNTFLLDGVQISAMGTTCGTVFCGFTGGQAPKVTMRGVCFAVQGTARLQVNIAQCHVVYEDCVLTQNSGDTYQVTGPTAGGGDQYGDPGSIQFFGCEVPNNMYSFCSTPTDAGDSLSWGYILAKDCFYTSYDAGTLRTARYAIDFEQNWQNQGRARNGPVLKRIIGKPANRQWPDTTGTFNWSVNLPVGATIIRILVYRAATGTNAAYTLTVGNQLSATAYGTSGASNTNLAQTISYDQSAAAGIANWTPVLNTNNQVTLFVTTAASGSGAVGSTGQFVIEYI